MRKLIYWVFISLIFGAGVGAGVTYFIVKAKHNFAPDGYNKVYSNNDYIVYGKNLTDLKDPSYGHTIPYSQTVDELDRYRTSYSDQGDAWYEDFTLSEVLGYLSHHQDKDGLRMYLAVNKDNRLHVIFAPLSKKPSGMMHAVWRDVTNRNAKDNPDDAFDTGAICPCNCPQSDPEDVAICNSIH